ncbi:MAG TPA: extensin family protein [Polyangiaceae bacterium]|nr:extensin family protein [Polyangiaceae bacterium]
MASCLVAAGILAWAGLAPAPLLPPSIPPGFSGSHAAENDAPPEFVVPPLSRGASTGTSTETFPFQKPLPARLATRTVGGRIARLSLKQCQQELKKRGIAIQPPKRPAPGVSGPVRLAGPLHGVRFTTPGPKVPYGILDCRLVLALDELSKVLDRYEVTGVRIDNFYRPGAKLPGKRKPSQHAMGLAADIMGFTRAGGRDLVFERDFQPTLGAPTCGPEASSEGLSEAAITLRNIVCDLSREGIFQHLLTPNHDRSHENHLHADIAREAKTLIVK